MPYCSNCGHIISNEAKFCENCGKPVSIRNTGESTRRVEYAGKMIKCPSCGEALKAFMPVCPACGYELRGTSASDAMERFSLKLENADNNEEKAEIINSFPVPNTREDIWEFLIMAIANINAEPDDKIFFAWQSKIEQTYQKAMLVFTDRKELSQIQEKYDQFKIILKEKKKEQSKKRAGESLSEQMTVMPQVIVITGWFVSMFIVLPLCKINVDSTGVNGYQLLIMFEMIMGAIFIPLTFRCGSALPALITTIGIAISIVFLVPLCKTLQDSTGFSPFHLILGVDIICAAVILKRGMKKSRQYSGERILFGGASFLTLAICTGVFLAAYGISTLRLPKTEAERSQMVNLSGVSGVSEEEIIDESAGIYTYEIRNYVGKNAASIGKIQGDYLIDEYGAGDLRIVFVAEDGLLLSVADSETKKQYTVTGQNLSAGSEITVFHLRDSRGKPYSNLADFLSYDEILLYVAPIGEDPYDPFYTSISPTLDKHLYHIRDYVGRNAASFGTYKGENRVDEYGHGKIKIAFASEDGSFVDVSDEKKLKQYVVTNQDIEADKELKLEYETDSRGKEFDNLVRNQNYEEITLTVKKVDNSVYKDAKSMPNLD